MNPRTGIVILAAVAAALLLASAIDAATAPAPVQHSYAAFVPPAVTWGAIFGAGWR